MGFRLLVSLVTLRAIGALRDVWPRQPRRPHEDDLHRQLLLGSGHDRDSFRRVDSLSAPRFRGMASEKNCTHEMLYGSGGKPVRIVASIATTGSDERLAYMKRTIDSLWNQTVKPHRIILTFPDFFRRKNRKVEVPDYVHEWRKDVPVLTVQQMKDYGPATKLLGALNLEKDPETVIIVGDDDVQYHRKFIETLTCTLLAPPCPEEVAPCFAGELPCQHASKTRWRVSRRFFGYGRGVGGVAYRVRYFDDFVWKVFDPAPPSGCFINDDVWIGGAMKKASGVLPFLVDNPGFNPVLAHGSCAPGQENCGFQSDSSTVAHEPDLHEKYECEHYFDDFCCPEMCVGGIYKKHGGGYESMPDTIWGHSSAKSPEELAKRNEQKAAMKKKSEEERLAASKALFDMASKVGAVLVEENADCEPSEWVPRKMSLGECARHCSMLFLYDPQDDRSCSCANDNCTKTAHHHPRQHGNLYRVR